MPDNNENGKHVANAGGAKEAKADTERLKKRIQRHYDVTSDQFLKVWYGACSPPSSHSMSSTSANAARQGRTHPPRLLQVADGYQRPGPAQSGHPTRRVVGSLRRLQGAGRRVRHRRDRQIPRPRTRLQGDGHHKQSASGRDRARADGDGGGEIEVPVVVTTAVGAGQHR